MDSESNLSNFTDILNEEMREIENSQPMSLRSISSENEVRNPRDRPAKHTGQYGDFRSTEEIDSKYRKVFTYSYFNMVQSQVIEDVMYSDKSLVVSAPTGSGKTVVFEMAIVKLLMDFEDNNYNDDFKIIYMAPVKAICTERLTEWYSKFTQLNCLCIEVTGDTDVDYTQLKPYRIIITTPEKWDIITRRWIDHRSLVESIKLFLIDEVHILNDNTRGPVLETVVSRMRTIEASVQSAHRIESLQRKIQNSESLTGVEEYMPRIRFVAVSATVSNPEDVATWLSIPGNPAVYHKFGDECRPVKIKRIVEGYPCPEGTSIFKFDIILNYKLWPIIQRHYFGKPTLIFCNTRKSVALTADALSREITITFNSEQKAKLTAIASSIKNRKLQSLILSGVGCHHAGLLFEERVNIENAFRSRDLPILITTTTLAMGVNLPAHLVIIKNTQQYVNGAYQEYSISTILQMVGRAGRPQFDTEATAVIMTRQQDKHRYQAMVGGSEPLQSYLHLRLAENLNSEVALGTVTDIAQCVQWLRSTFLYVRAGRDPRRYLNIQSNSPLSLISKKIEELCVKAMNGLATNELIAMDETGCIQSTEAGKLMSVYYLDFETMKHIMKIDGTESLERLLWLVCESHELAEMHLRIDERRCLNTLNKSTTAATIRFPMKGKISTRQMKLNCIIQAILGCLQIPEPSLSQEAVRIMRIADRVCKCMLAYITRPELVNQQPPYYSAILNGIILSKCITSQLWENSPYVCRQLKGIGPAFSTLLVTAGKTNFMLLEESHPRDLERIMNKCAPAGNVLRKQVSLLPKYQLTLTQITERTLSIKVALVNLIYLSENMDQLTAGENHKCYIVVGDERNTLLLLTSFKDKDLINIYDGCATFSVDRRDKSEYKIIVNCISSTYVGIDVQMEYTFENLNTKNSIDVNRPIIGISNVINKSSTFPKVNKPKKQTVLTDIYREQKKRNNTDIDVSQSKEKRKRATAIIEQFNSLKESFSNSSKGLRNEIGMLNKRTDNMFDETSHKEVSYDRIDISQCDDLEKNMHLEKKISIPYDNTLEDLPSISNDTLTLNENMQDTEKVNNISKEIENEMKINNILKDIENEMTHKSSQHYNVERKLLQIDKTAENKVNQNKKIKRNKPNNYDFIETVEKSYDDDVTIGNKKDRFADSIKDTLNMFLNDTKQNINKDHYDYLSIDTPAIIDNGKYTTYKHMKPTTSNEDEPNKKNNSPKVMNDLIENQSVVNDLRMDFFEENYSLETVKSTSMSSNYEQEHLIKKGVTSLDKHEQINYLSKPTPFPFTYSNTNQIGDSQINNRNKDLAVYVKNSNNFGKTVCNQVPSNTVENIKNNAYINNNIPITNFNVPKPIRPCYSTARNAIKDNSSLPLLKMSTEGQQQNMSKLYNHQPQNTDDNKNQFVLNVDKNMQDLCTTEHIPGYYKDNNKKSNNFIKINDIQTTTSCNLSTHAVNFLPNRKTVSQCQFELVKRIRVDFELTKTLDDAQSTFCNESTVMSSDNTNLDSSILKIAPKLDDNDICIPIDINNSNSSLSKIMHTNINNMITYSDNIINNSTSNNENKTLNKVNSCYESNCESINDILNKYSEVLKNDDAVKTAAINIPLSQNVNQEPKKIKHKMFKIQDINNVQIDIPSSLIPVEDIQTSPVDNEVTNQSQGGVIEDEKYFSDVRNDDAVETAATNISLLQNISQEAKKTKQKMFKIQDIKNVKVDIPSSLIPLEDIQNSPVYEMINQSQQDVNEDDDEINKTDEPIQYEIEEQPVEINIDTNIDQCLLDPKKLLECFQRAEPLQDTIPPPVEFSDYYYEKEMSEDKSTQAVPRTMKQIDDDDYYKECVQEKNVFRDEPGPTVASINISSSHEVETWTLSPEVEDNQNFTDNSQRSFKSCTVMRTNRSRYFNSRIADINSFKFTIKNKLHKNTPKY